MTENQSRPQDVNQANDHAVTALRQAMYTRALAAFAKRHEDQLRTVGAALRDDCRDDAIKIAERARACAQWLATSLEVFAGVSRDNAVALNAIADEKIGDAGVERAAYTEDEYADALAQELAGLRDALGDVPYDDTIPQPSA